MSITKIAFVRGIAQSLQYTENTAYNYMPGMNYVAEKAASLLSVEPAESNVPYDDVLKIAQYLIAQDTALESQGKTASTHGSRVYYASQEDCVGDLIVKCAKLVHANITGTSVSDPQPENSLGNAATLSNLGKAEVERRPEGYANVGQGNTNFSEPQAARTGTEQPHPHQQMNDSSVSNSAADSSKSAGLRAAMQKLSSGVSGTSVTEDHPENSLMNAASLSNLGKSEIENRPEGYANVGQGNTNFSEPQAARIGTEQPHPHQQMNDSSVSNSAADSSKTAQVWDQLRMHLQTQMNQKLASQHGVRLNEEDQKTVTRHLMQSDPAHHDAILAKTAQHIKQIQAQQAPRTIADLLRTN